MKVFLAGIESLYAENIEKFNNAYVLTSFYSYNNTADLVLKRSKDCLLDSGAFTFMRGKAHDTDFDAYVERYADFINRSGIEKFFELDIDNVVGYEKVKQLRNRLERLTQKKSIPVWHVARGFDEYQKMCDEYEYVAIGGIANKEIRKENYKVFPRLIYEAHKRNTKVHGLGFTDTRKLNDYHFDSVDSTSWSWGRFGYHFVFNGKNMQMVPKPEGMVCAKRAELQGININEWRKFQSYADKNL